MHVLISITDSEVTVIEMVHNRHVTPHKEHSYVCSRYQGGDPTPGPPRPKSAPDYIIVRTLFDLRPCT